MSNKTSKRLNSVLFFSFPKLLFIWPIIMLGYLFCMPGCDGSLLCGWIYLIAAALVILTLGIDLERNYAVFWLVFFIAFYFIGLWLKDAKNIPLLSNMFSWFWGLKVEYRKDFGLAMSILLTLPYTIMLFWVWTNHRWRITHNEFEHYSWGRADDSLARGAKRVRSTYPDLLELLLAGAGTLIVYSATGRQELRRIRHIPLLFLVRRKIDILLEVTAVTDTDSLLEAETDDSESEEAGYESVSESEADSNGDKDAL